MTFRIECSKCGDLFETTARSFNLPYVCQECIEAKEFQEIISPKSPKSPKSPAKGTIDFKAVNDAIKDVASGDWDFKDVDFITVYRDPAPFIPEPIEPNATPTSEIDYVAIYKELSEIPDPTPDPADELIADLDDQLTRATTALTTANELIADLVSQSERKDGIIKHYDDVIDAAISRIKELTREVAIADQKVVWYKRRAEWIEGDLDKFKNDAEYWKRMYQFARTRADENFNLYVKERTRGFWARLLNRRGE